METLAADWQPAGQRLPPDQKLPAAPPLTVYRMALTDFAPHETALRELLTPAERARAARLARLHDQSRFLVGRGCLRYLLGQRLEQAPTTIPLQLGRFGKPQLPRPAGVHFNVAHSGDWVLVAVGEREVGVDLEQQQPDFDFASVVAHCFSAAEQQGIYQSAEPREAFYSLWTRLEARAKAMGGGLSDDPTATLTGGYIRPWAVHSFEVAPGYPGAVAYPADWKPAVLFRTFEASLIS